MDETDDLQRVSPDLYTDTKTVSAFVLLACSEGIPKQ